MRLADAILLCAGADLAAALNVGPNYQYPLEGMFSCLGGYLQGSQLSFSPDLDKDLPFSQPVTFAHLEWQRCLAESHNKVYYVQLKSNVKFHLTPSPASRHCRSGIPL